MLTLIERLRGKPKAVRVQVSFAAAAVLTALVALVWGATLPLRLGGLASVTSPASEAPVEESASFFSAARANMAQLIGAFGGETAEPTEESSTETGVSGTYQTGAPADAAPYQGAGLDRRSVALPVSAREVRIATSTD